MRRRSGLEWAAFVVGALVVVWMALMWWGESSARREPLATGEIPGTWLEQWAITTHVIPMVLAVISLVLAWRWLWVGALVFLGYPAVLTLVAAATGDGAYLVFALPYAIAGILFLLAWLKARGSPQPAPTP